MGNAAKQLTQSTPTTYTHSFKEFTSSISVLSYNILADCYVDPLYFPYAKKNSLAFAQRAQKIVFYSPSIHRFSFFTN
jgi:mRNA deadenylase 3'-5' endonuclease subunit Ccr4